MNKIVAFLLIILISFSYERMRCFDDLDGSPTEKCMVEDVFNGLQYYDSCKKGKICIPAEDTLSNLIRGSLTVEEGETANYGVCAPLPYGGFEGAVCGDNAECFSYNCDGTSCGEPKEFCKMQSECKKGQYCDNEGYNDGKNNILPTYQCKDFTSSCYYDFQCPPLNLCLLNTNSVGGSCKKIGSIADKTPVPSSRSVPNEIILNLLCKSGYSINDICVKEATYNCATREGKVVTYDDAEFKGDRCRESLLDDSDIPIVTTESIKAFEEYFKEVNDIEVKPDKKHANYGYIRYHYDKSKLKELLTKAIYHELNNEDDETAECLLDYVKQITLSGEKINFSKILVLTFALLLI